MFLGNRPDVFSITGAMCIVSASYIVFTGQKNLHQGIGYIISAGTCFSLTALAANLLYMNNVPISQFVFIRSLIGLGITQTIIKQ